jgi:hypothetical protein
MFDVSYGAGQWETQFASKDSAIDWARINGGESFEIIDAETDRIVYQELPQITFI